ncbi:hypothetical protein KXS07_02475 [Inquilinus limosus]|uniref:hypothetical protein n=1 Tax=Inquilinus limosus TaxID=171674 RepID=UPI003F137D8B
MSEQLINLKSFLETVRAQGLSEDLTKAARHHSAANIAEADKILKDLQKDPSSER